MIARLFAVIAALGFAVSVEAAEITTDGKVVWISGPFVSADGERFKSVSAAVRDGATIVLESEGGSAGASIAIGEEIKRRKFATAVLARKSCVSACAFAWLAGNPRIMDRAARIGFHAVYLVEDGRPVTSTAANAVMGSYLGSLGIPASAIYFATSAGPDGMNWMTQDIASKLGVSVFVFGTTTTDQHPNFGRLRKPPKSKKSLLNQLYGSD